MRDETAESRRQKAEGRKQKAESSTRQVCLNCLLPIAFCLLFLSIPSFHARKIGGERDGGDHAGMLGYPAPRDVERRAVIDRRAYERQPKCNVDRLAE